MKPIPTEYNGVRYRSRVEARWAVFFEKMGWPVVYEQQGVDIEGTWYLPDFWLPEFSTFVEIKAENPSDEEMRKCRLLAIASGKDVWLIAGSPGFDTYDITRFPAEHAPHRFMDCRRCERTVLYYRVGDAYGWDEIGPKCESVFCGDRNPNYMGRVDKALHAARNERFGVHDD